MGNCFLYKRGMGSVGASEVVYTAMGKLLTFKATDKPLKGLRIFGKTTQNGTPTPDVPVPLESVGDGGSVGVTVCGKNLLKTDFSEITKADVTFKPETNGGVSVSGTATDYAYEKIYSVYLQKGITYYANLFGKGGGVDLRIIDRSVSPVYIPRNKVGSFTVNKSGEYAFEITVLNTFSGSYTVYPQLEIGSNATAYEPYKGQILTLQTPNGLPGIPVSSGGNYTDENGQQWVCDEVDFGRGKYVQRIAKGVYDGSESWNTVSTEAGTKANRLLNPDPPAKPAVNNNKLEGTNIKSSEFITVPAGIGGVYSSVEGIAVNTSGHLAIYWERYNTPDVSLWKAYLADNPMTVIYELATPIETPLSAEELAAYAELHTNYPNTTIFNDAGAWMEVKYL